MPENGPDYAALDEAFERKFDIARMVLEKKHRWAKYVLRNLQPVRSIGHPTVSVDAYLRLYHGEVADTWEGKEFVGAIWHEVNHILRHHHDRLSDLPGRLNTDPKTILISADLEINDDLADQGVLLPEGTGVYSDMYGHQPGRSAEEHVLQFIQEQVQQPDKGDGADAGDGEPDPDNDSEGAGDGEGNQPNPDSGDNEGEGDDGDEDADGDSPGSNDGDGSDGDGESEGDQPSNGSPQLPEGHHGCGSGAGDEPIPDELPPPDEKEQGKLERVMQKQSEDIIEASSGSGLPPGMSPDMVEAAVEFVGKTEHDWRRTMATEIRNAMEQRADEAEEYSFRRQSRRAGAVGDDYILPGSFRPIPKLFVFADVSGSMDQNKLTASVREVHGILERLAIPSFIACGWNTQMTSHVEVASFADVDAVFAHRGGGTDMQAAVDQGIEEGAEVIVVLTDNDTRWNENGPNGVPVIIGGINRSPGRAVPVWSRLVDVGEVPDVNMPEAEWSW